MSCVCDPVSVDGYEWNRWVGRHLHECLYTPQDWAAFIIGWTSPLFWFCCQLPQFYKNWKNKSATALSIVFLLEWFAGDFLNLVSSVLTGQLTTQIATATLFIVMDIFLCIQYFYYTKVYRGRRTSTASPEGERYTSLYDSGNEEEEQEKESSKRLTIDEIDVEGEITSNKPIKKVSSVPALAVYSPLLLATFWFSSYVALSSLQNDVASSSFRPSTTNGRIVGIGPSARRLLDSSSSDDLCNGDLVKSHTIETIGIVLAYCSAIVYLTSRLPQIYKNWVRGSVEGLSPYMFACAVMGNLTYALGVLVKRPSSSDLTSALPFLIGSVGTTFFDAVILAQYVYYNRWGHNRRPLYLVRLDTGSRRRVPRGLHDIVDPMVSPFFKRGK